MQIAIYAEENIIQTRLSKRSNLTRFEKGNQTATELSFLEEGVQLLEKIGINILRVVNNDMLDENIKTIVNCIVNL